MTSFMKSNPKLHLYGWLWASDLLPMTSSVKEACSLNEVMIRINVRMCLILTTKMMKMTKMMMVNMGSVCGDYREHQVTSYALSANDRAPMNRRKKSRQTDSFGIDRKRASKLRQTDLLCIDRKRSAIDRETDILIFLPFSWNFVLGWHDCQWIFVGLSFHLNFFSDINLLWGAAGRSSDDGWCITGAKVWQGNPLSSMLASSQDYPGQWYLRLKYAKTTSHNDFQLWWISDFLEQPPLHNDPAVN